MSFELFLLPWAQSDFDTSKFLCGVKENVTLDCASFSCWDPKDDSEIMLAEEVEEGELGEAELVPSKGRSLMMKVFSELVGFPIVKHEEQCLAPFCILELECLDLVKVG
nr:hypothetical protein CFP56_75454 [Quercus suber]POE52958.1 hypothetical protein CFP56_36134 [Quercus suber]